MEQNSIWHFKIAPYHPSSNSLAEQAIQSFKDAMKNLTVTSKCGIKDITIPVHIQQLGLPLLNYWCTSDQSHTWICYTLVLLVEFVITKNIRRYTMMFMLNFSCWWFCSGTQHRERSKMVRRNCQTTNRTSIFANQIDRRSNKTHGSTENSYSRLVASIVLEQQGDKTPSALVEEVALCTTATKTTQTSKASTSKVLPN